MPLLAYMSSRKTTKIYDAEKTYGAKYLPTYDISCYKQFSNLVRSSKTWRCRTIRGVKTR